jgi:hypothetical protein
MVSLVLGGLLLVGGVGCLFGRRGALAKVQQLRGATPRTPNELIQVSSEVAADIGAGSFAEVVEVRGLIECAAPLTSELAEHPCVHYSGSVVQEYEETRIETDNDTGEQRQATHRGTETMSSSTRSVPFRLSGPGGTIEVLPDGADIETEQVLNRFEPETSMLQGGMLAFGGFQLSMTGRPMLGPSRRVLGYRLTESILPVGRQAFVIGEATDSEGRLVLRKPADKASKFIISVGSKEVLIQATEKRAKWLLVGAIACGIAALGALVAGLLG